MPLLTKIFTAIRGGARESLEVVVDANALRILDQEIHDTEAAINRSKHDLTQVIAEKIRMEREIATLKNAIAYDEKKALVALDNDRQDIALEYANSIAENEAVLRDAEQKLRQLEQYQADLKHRLKKVIRQMQHYRREWRMAKATASTQAASARIQHRGHHLGSHISDMENSLQRIQHRQQQFVDNLAASEDVEASLAGVQSDFNYPKKPPLETADSVLARIRKNNLQREDRSS